ncbi:MAG: BrnA antitoxin family protein [Coriobacteriia bacterium]|nr:BrnA antitoxin family protein [Coriobacteriia bacterium]
MKSEEFDRLFDEGKDDIVEHLDLSSARRPNRKTRKVNVDLPEWMIVSLDAEADRLAINRQAVIKTWLAERIDGDLPRIKV